MGIIRRVIVVCSLLLFVSNTLASNLTKEIEFICNEGFKVSDVRIQECFEPPCKVKKDSTVLIELDFTFQVPTSTNDVTFDIIDWNGVREWGEQAVKIAKRNNCTELNLKSCPAVAGQLYTLKADFSADRLAELILAESSKVRLLSTASSSSSKWETSQMNYNQMGA